jgi:hypothetical protein
MIGHHIYPFDFFFQLFKNFSEGPIKHANTEQLYERTSLSIDRSVLLFFCSFLLIVMQKRRWVSNRIFLILISGILVVDLYLFGGQFVRPHRITTTPKKRHIVSQLHNDPFQGRVVTVRNLFKTNDGLRYGFPSILGYDPLILKRYVYYVLASQGYPPDDHVVNLGFIKTPNTKLLKLLNVKQMVLAEKVESLNNEIPYAHVVRNAATKKLDKILPFMMSDDFDPRSTVVFDREYAVDRAPLKENESFRASCSVMAYSNESLTIKSSANGNGYLVLSEIFYPGWQATVDGKKVPVLCGNYLFRVIPLDRGEHEIHMRFISWPLRIGGIISLLTLLGSLSFILRGRKEGALSREGKGNEVKGEKGD